MKRFLLLLLIALVPLSASADQVIREDTATQIALGPFLDGTDGVTAETALTVTEFDCDLVKHANSSMTNTALTITASGGSNDAAHITSGMYSLELTATDTNTAGRLTIICDHATPATFIPVRQTYMVMPTQEFDSLYGTDVQQVHVVEFTSGVIDATAIATDAIGSAELAAGAVTEIQTGLATSSALATTDGVADNILAAIGSPSNLGGGATLAFNLSDIEAQTDDIGAAGAGLTNIDLPNQTMNITGTLSGTVGGIAGTITTLDALDTAQDSQHATTQGVVNNLALEQHVTTIATLASQVSFTLTAGSADDDAYNGNEIIVIDSSTSTQQAVGMVENYTGSTRTVTLMIDPGIFTMAVGDTVVIRPAGANVRQMNGYEITGDGTTGTEWSGTGDGGH